MGHQYTALLLGCSAAVVLGDGTRVSTRTVASRARLDGDLLVIRTAGTAARPEIRWYIAHGDRRALRLWAEVENTTPRPLEIDRVEVLLAPSGYRRAPMRDLEIMQTGWHSWSFAAPPARLPSGGFPPEPPEFRPTGWTAEPGRAATPWVTLLHTPGERSLLAGFITARDYLGAIAIQPAPTGHRCTAWIDVEGIGLQPRARLRSETLLLVFDSPDAAALERYAEELGTAMGATRWPQIPTGWCSWYYFFGDVTERDVLRNLEVLAAERRRVPLEYVQLDDGYQAQVGDWLNVNANFPRGMRFLSDAIRARGFKPGLWLAPFLVSERSDVYAQHPDWVVRDHLDHPVVAIHNWGMANYALDTTHPEAVAWLRHVVRTVADDWGFEYLKIDFAYAAALSGRRHDRGQTSVQAYRRGLEVIRAAAGARFLLGCGAPFAPSVGLVDGMRVGPDVSPFWIGLQGAVRSTLAHGWMHRRLWINDPDCLLVRGDASELTLPEIQSWLSIIGLSGGSVFVSDDLDRLEPERAALIPLVLPPLGQPGAIQDLGIDWLAERLRMVVERPWETWRIEAIFNWSGSARPLTYQPAGPDELRAAPYHLFDLWTREHVGPVTGQVVLPPTPVHGARLLSIHADRGRPQLIGSTLHILSGAVELADECWLNNTLYLTLRCSGERSGALYVYVPDTYHYQAAEIDCGIVEEHGRLLLLRVRLVESTKIALRFEA